MNSLKYKGYIGSVRFSEDDGVFLGEIEGIDGLVTFQGSSIKELTDDFHKAVDNYIAFCKEHGLPAKKSYSGTLNIRISPATHNSIADFAAAEGITINAFIKRALEKAVKDPASVMVPMVGGYSPREIEPATLGEPSVSYGSKDIAEFWIHSTCQDPCWKDGMGFSGPLPRIRARTCTERDTNRSRDGVQQFR